MPKHFFCFFIYFLNKFRERNNIYISFLKSQKPFFCFCLYFSKLF